mgnify:FL=1
MNFTQMDDYSKDPNILEKFGRNIVEAVRLGKIDPVIGREERPKGATQLFRQRPRGQSRRLPAARWLHDSRPDRGRRRHGCGARAKSLSARWAVLGLTACQP